MPDPISIASATALALHAAHLTKDFIAAFIMPQKPDLAALEAVLKQLEVQLKKDPHLKNPANVETVRLVQQPLKNCTADAKQIKELLRKFVKPSGAAKTGKWNGFMFTFREKELRDLQYRLRDSRETLEGGLLVGTYVIGLDSNAEIHDANEGVRRLDHRFVQYQLRRGEDEYSMVNTSYARSDVLGLEVGSRIPQWLDGTETFVGHGDKFPPAMSVVEDEWDFRSTVTVHEDERVREAQMSDQAAPLSPAVPPFIMPVPSVLDPDSQIPSQSDPEAAQQQPSAVADAAPHRGDTRQGSLESFIDLEKTRPRRKPLSTSAEQSLLPTTAASQRTLAQISNGDERDRTPYGGDRTSIHPGEVVANTLQHHLEPLVPGAFPALTEPANTLGDSKSVTSSRNPAAALLESNPLKAADAVDTGDKATMKHDVSAENWFNGLEKWSHRRLGALPSRAIEGTQTTTGKDPQLARGVVHEARVMHQQQASKPVPQTTTAASNMLLRKNLGPTETPKLWKPAKRMKEMKPLRKTIVSRAALTKLNIDFLDDEHETVVLVDADVEPIVIAKARELSLELSGPNRKEWWPREGQTQPGSKPPDTPAAPPVRTLSGLGERLFGRSGSVMKKQDRDSPRQNAGRKYPSTSMKDTYAAETPGRPSMDSERSFSFGLGKKKSVDLEPQQDEKPGRRFSLIPPSMSLKGMMGGSYTENPPTDHAQPCL